MSQIPDKLTKPYEPTSTEGRIYDLWEKSGFFNPDNLPGDRPESFSIVLPPPNVTGILHMGSALMLAIEDVMVRYARMSGKRTLWIPGTDHAAIATQAKVEKEIQKTEGKNRHDLGREELLNRINDFAKSSHDTIVDQIKVLGASVDWSREAFTLDDKRNLAVKTAFKKMYDDGLIYRGLRVVNWDPKGQTTISDDEIVYESRQSKLYTFKYSKDFPISISTTRPETKVGDVAVAVHPDDSRYKEFVGKEYNDIDFCGVKINIRIIADDLVDKDFGTGALGVTPAHSHIDDEMANKHNLPKLAIINEYAKMSVGDDRLLGKKTTEARDIIIDWLKTEGLLEKEEIIEQNVATAERTGGIVEPLPKLQWFMAVNKEFEHQGKTTTLKKLMLQAVESQSTKIIPDRFEKIYFHWINNLRDWCISRQIWYGHRVPVWYKDDKTYCGIEAPDGEGWTQDEDTLDTWFSSGLWTFSTLGWPNEEEFSKQRQYHPTTILETGSDILFFWVARMILMSTYILGEVPFKTAYLHGLGRDEKGRKISKSLGNNIDPVDMSKKYGADATRMSLIVGVGAGNDSKLGEDKIKAYKHFANKIWNASRFVLENTESIDLTQKPTLTDTDSTYLTKLETTIAEITADLENYRLHLASEKLYHYFWHTFADEIIEDCKNKLKTGTEVEKMSAQYTLRYILITNLKLLHPFMPFITEEIWGMIEEAQGQLLIIEPWPSSNA